VGRQGRLSLEDALRQAGLVAAGTKHIGAKPKKNNQKDSLEVECVPGVLVGVGAEGMRSASFPALIEGAEGFQPVLGRSGNRVRLPAGALVPIEELIESGEERVWEILPEARGTTFGATLKALSRMKLPGLILVLAVGLGQAFQLGVPLATAWAFNSAISLGDIGLLSTIALGLLALVVFDAFLAWFRTLQKAFLSERVQIPIRAWGIRKFMRTSFLKASKFGMAEISLGVHSGGHATHLLIDRGGEGLALTFGVISQGAALGMLFPFGLGVALLGGGLVLVLCLTQASRVLLHSRREVETQNSELNFMAELFNGVLAIKAAGVGRLLQGRWEGLLDSRLAAAFRKQRVVDRLRLLQTFALDLTRVAVLILGAQAVHAGEIGLGTLLGSLALATGVARSLAEIGNYWIEARTLAPNLEAGDALHGLPEEAFAGAVPEDPEQAGVLIAEDVWFRYEPESPWVLRGFSLKVEPGEQVEIPGVSGSGKSTTLRVLAGLLQPDRGRVLVGGRSPQSAKQDFLYLPQFTQLLSASIRRNIEVLSGGASFERIQHAAHETGLAEFIQTLPMGWDTVLAIGGANISGGQRQMILLTACLASNRKILLLDEAMANLDWGRRVAIGRSELMRGKTIVFASHDGRPLLG